MELLPLSSTLLELFLLLSYYCHLYLVIMINTDIVIITVIVIIIIIIIIIVITIFPFQSCVRTISDVSRRVYTAATANLRNTIFDSILSIISLTNYEAVVFTDT